MFVLYVVITTARKKFIESAAFFHGIELFRQYSYADIEYQNEDHQDCGRQICNVLGVYSGGFREGAPYVKRQCLARPEGVERTHG